MWSGFTTKTIDYLRHLSLWLIEYEISQSDMNQLSQIKYNWIKYSNKIEYIPQFNTIANCDKNQHNKQIGWQPNNQ